MIDFRVKRMRFELWGGGHRSYGRGVGQQFSVTCERIRTIEAKALRKLKHPAEAAIWEFPGSVTSSCSSQSGECSLMVSLADS